MDIVLNNPTSNSEDTIRLLKLDKGKYYLDGNIVDKDFNKVAKAYMPIKGDKSQVFTDDCVSLWSPTNNATAVYHYADKMCEYYNQPTTNFAIDTRTGYIGMMVLEKILGEDDRYRNLVFSIRDKDSKEVGRRVIKKEDGYNRGNRDAFTEFNVIPPVPGTNIWVAVSKTKYNKNVFIIDVNYSNGDISVNRLNYSFIGGDNQVDERAMLLTLSPKDKQYIGLYLPTVISYYGAKAFGNFSLYSTLVTPSSDVLERREVTYEPCKVDMTSEEMDNIPNKYFSNSNLTPLTKQNRRYRAYVSKTDGKTYFAPIKTLDYTNTSIDHTNNPFDTSKTIYSEGLVDSDDVILNCTNIEKDIKWYRHNLHMIADNQFIDIITTDQNIIEYLCINNSSDVSSININDYTCRVLWCRVDEENPDKVYVEKIQMLDSIYTSKQLIRPDGAFGLCKFRTGVDFYKVDVNNKTFVKVDQVDTVDALAYYILDDKFLWTDIQRNLHLSNTSSGVSIVGNFETSTITLNSEDLPIKVKYNVSAYNGEERVIKNVRLICNGNLEFADNVKIKEVTTLQDRDLTVEVTATKAGSNNWITIQEA